MVKWHVVEHELLRFRMGQSTPHQQSDGFKKVWVLGDRGVVLLPEIVGVVVIWAPKPWRENVFTSTQNIPMIFFFRNQGFGSLRPLKYLVSWGAMINKNTLHDDGWCILAAQLRRSMKEVAALLVCILSNVLRT